MESSYHYLILLLVALPAAWLFAKAAQRAFAGPLSKLPGPFLNRWTTWPLKIAVLCGRRTQYIHSLHIRYGRAIRITPSEVSVSDLQSLYEINKIGGGFVKSEWYADFVNEHDGVHGMFSITNPKEHAERRRHFSRAFATQSIQDWEPFVQSRVQLAISKIKNLGQHGGVDILAWWSFMTMDVVTKLSFGETMGTLENGQKSKFQSDLDESAFWRGLRIELPWVGAILYRIPLPSLQHLIGSEDRQEVYAKEVIQQSKRLNELKGTFFGKVFEEEGMEKSLTDLEIVRDAKAFIIAGTETTAITLTYFIWVMSKHPDIRRRVQREVDSLSPGFTSQDVYNLPYLQKVIMENFRLYTAAPNSLPRMVPKGGKELGGYFIPEQTTVSCQAFSLHRDPTIFPDPLTFDPDRWSNPTRAMRDAMSHFGGGTRACIGKHLALMEINLGLSHFFRECPNMEIAPSTTDESMDFDDRFLIKPKGQKCLVVIP
ncbi:MAG: hypothetical protein MMC33_000709 [Icmadophila ericetorum]|nr:hypothetical protein [Icmadophila ericetorum]